MSVLARAPLLVAIFLAGIAVDASATLVDIDSTAIYARARDGTGPTDGAVFTGTTNNINTTLTASSGSTSAETEITWTGDAGNQVFDFQFDHTRGIAWNSFAKSDAFNLTFTAAASSSYELSGVYDTTETEGTAVFALSLFDMTDGEYLFRNVQENRGSVTDPASFILGGVEGNWGSVLVEGALSGTLTGGHQYRLFLDAFIQSVPVVGSSAHAEGFARMSISVPAPAPWTLALFGLVLLKFSRRQR